MSSSEIEQEFEKNVAELWGKDRDELKYLRAQNRALTAALRKAKGALESLNVQEIDDALAHINKVLESGPPLTTPTKGE